MKKYNTKKEKIYTDMDAELKNIQNKTIAVIGFGSHGRAHALNLDDSGLEVIVGLRARSSSRNDAKNAGLTVMSPLEAAAEADIIAFFVPDTVQAELYDEIQEEIKPRDTLLFPHGFSIVFNQIELPADVDVSLVAPKAPGELVREKYKQGGGTPGVYAIDQDASGEAESNALAYAKAIGCTSGGLIETTFEEETITDLFGEQAILCGGVPYLIMSAYQTLIEHGYSREMAYFECLNELYYVVELMFEGGIDAVWSEASNTSEYGGLTRGKKVIDESISDNLEQILSDVEDGTFATEWIAENENGGPKFGRLKSMERDHDLEKIGEHIRRNLK